MFPSTSTTTLFSLLSTIPLFALAQMTPTSPDASTVVDVGSSITATWTADKTGSWDDVTLTLMSGDNWAMVPVVTIATGLDATTLTSYTFAAPDVTPNSAIYFLQYQPAANASAYEWTTRFTIAGTDGSTTTPANTTQPDGESIPWGVGTLVGTYSTGATLANSTTTAGTASSTAAAGGLSVIATTAAVATVTASSSVAVVTTSASTGGLVTSAVSAVSSATSAAAAAATTSAATSGAGRTVAGVGAICGLFVSLGLVGMSVAAAW